MKKTKCLTIQVKRRFDCICHKVFKEAFSAHGKAISYNVDLVKVSYLKSFALGIRLLLRGHTSDGNCAVVRLIQWKSPVVGILKIAKFHRFFTIIE